MPRKVAALFVADGGPYFDVPSVDPWPLARDARRYRGPHPVVAHPPCERWGRYWSGGPSAKRRHKLGDDGGCFATALMHVRRWGGVLEHPAHSHAFRIFGLGFPPPEGGWIPELFCQGGWICHVEQGHYGHPARKATWLYAALPPGEHPPELKWGPSQGKRIDEGFHTNDERARARCRSQAGGANLALRTRAYAVRLSKSALAARRARAIGLEAFECLPKSRRHITPPAFREVLVRIARRSLCL